MKRSKGIILTLLVIGALSAMAACKTYEAPAASIAGMLHTNLSGADTTSNTVSGFVILDTDSDYSNGYSQRASISLDNSVPGALDSLEGVAYGFDSVPAGSYYLYAIIDTGGDGELTMTTASHDAYAYYGNNTANDYNVFVPPAANVIVDTEGYLTCDFWVGIPYNNG
jgi:uncharacterized protein (DUF2141 family)